MDCTGTYLASYDPMIYCGLNGWNIAALTPLSASAAIAMNHFIHSQPNKVSYNDPSNTATEPRSSVIVWNYSYETST